MRLFPVFRLASALAGILLVLVFTGNLLLGGAATSAGGRSRCCFAAAALSISRACASKSDDFTFASARRTSPIRPRARDCRSLVG